MKTETLVTNEAPAVSGGLLTTEAAAAYLGCSPATLNTWRSTGAVCVPFVRIGALVRYRRSDLEAWLASRTYRHTGEAAQ
jgi:excisionase family DNA binding protein